MPKKMKEAIGETLQSYPMRVQAMKSKGARPNFFVYIPIPIASMLGITGGTEMSWELLSRSELHLMPVNDSTSEQVTEHPTATYPLRVHAIKTKGPNPRFFVVIPQPLAAPIGIMGGEEVSWKLVEGMNLHLIRKDAPLPSVKSAMDA